MVTRNLTPIQWGIWLGIVLSIFLLIQIVSASCNPYKIDCIKIDNETYNSTRLKFMITTLYNHSIECDKNLSAYPFIIEKLNSNIDEKNKEIKYSKITIIILSALYVLLMTLIFIYLKKCGKIELFLKNKGGQDGKR